MKYINAKVFTGTEYRTSFCVENGKFSKESSDGIVIDLKGKTVLPAFIDVHMHAYLSSQNMSKVALLKPYVNNIPELLEALKRKKEEVSKDDFILGYGYDEQMLDEKRAPTLKELDEVSDTNPIRIERSDCHSCIMNSVAIKKMNIPDKMQAGVIDKENGYFAEEAFRYTDKFISLDSIKNIEKYGEKLLSLGITTSSEMMAEEYQVNLFKKAKFKPRIAMFVNYNQNLKDKDFDTDLIRGVKIFTDGSISAKTAFMNEKYKNGGFGFSSFSKEILDSAYEYCKTRNYQIAIHAMGDRSICDLIEYIKTKEKYIENAPSFRIEHASILSDKNIEDIKKYGIGISQQIIFYFAEYRSYFENLNENQLKNVLRIKDCFLNIPYFALSSDAPATTYLDPENVFLSIYAAVSAKTYDGKQISNEQKLSVEQAIKAYTVNAAKLLNYENLGEIKEGYIADFIILDKDIFSVDLEEIKDIKVEKTYMKGEKVWEI